MRSPCGLLHYLMPIHTGWQQQGSGAMSKKHHGGPVPPGNRPKTGTPSKPGEDVEEPIRKGGEVPSQQEEDPKRRLGDFTGKGEHSIQEPGGKDGANH
jgi:hypothetical protein